MEFSLIDVHPDQKLQNLLTMLKNQMNIDKLQITDSEKAR